MCFIIKQQGKDNPATPPAPEEHRGQIEAQQWTKPAGNTCNAANNYSPV